MTTDEAREILARAEAAVREVDARTAELFRTLDEASRHTAQVDQFIRHRMAEFQRLVDNIHEGIERGRREDEEPWK